MPLFFDIKRYSINDGPGIRITIFIKGCPMSCVWCHNPEGISPEKQKMYSLKRCIGCGKCISVCPANALSITSDKGIRCNNKLCSLCGKCVEVCPSKAMDISGTEYSTDYLMQQIEKETIFMDRSEGGVTFCGGEPLLYPDILSELLTRCGELSIHRAVDTTLFAKTETVEKILQQTDLFLVDLKHMNPAKHKEFCGVSNELILSNLRMIAEAGVEFIIRIPLIEGINADTQNITDTAKYLSALPWKRKLVNLLPYHEIAAGKHEKMGTTCNPQKIRMGIPTSECLQQCIKIFNSFGCEATIG